jgi:putative peptide zinc metalloprotease protein
MAVNTTDNTVQYDVAFALVWIDDDSPAMNKNEAYAFASCTNCAAVAVGFQIVLVTGDNHVAVPQNISAAVNSDCVNCLTYALATQLFVTLDGPLSEAGTQQISALWQEIASFGTHITEVPLSEIRSRLTAYETQILQIIEKEQGPLTGAPTATPSEGASPSGGVTPSDLASPTAADPGASTSSDPTAGNSDAPSGTSTDATSPAATASTDPTPTSSATPTPDATPAAATPADATPTP